MRSFSVKFLIVLLAAAFSACQKSEADDLNLRVARPVPSPTITPVSSIREVDFKNFSYPWTKDHTVAFRRGEKFSLKNGEKELIPEEEEIGASFKSIEYGDVTSDGVEEAMISIAPIAGGNCSCEMVFIYALENREPKLLWSFDSWDKASGGFKRAYGENGDLIIENFGDNKFENGEWKFDWPKNFKGLCCPTAYTKIRFRWDGTKFDPVGQPEIFDYDYKPPK